MKLHENKTLFRQAVQFPDDQSAIKAVYLAINNIQKKWNMPIQNWGLILHQFLTIFEDRCRL